MTAFSPGQVCDWVEYLGLPYRKKFLHHLVDGRIALQLTNADLKARTLVDSISMHNVADHCNAETRRMSDGINDKGGSGLTLSGDLYRRTHAERARHRSVGAPPHAAGLLRRAASRRRGARRTVRQAPERGCEAAGGRVAGKP